MDRATYKSMKDLHDSIFYICWGGSCLNKVELQNGCLAMGHSNLFIPSTIYGSNFLNREIDEDTLVTNSDAALGVHMNTVNGAPCGRKPISI